MVGSKFVQDALRQATIDTSSSWDATILPQGIDARIPLCAQGHTCTGGINLDSVLVPKFISLIPRDSRETDSTRSGFEVYRDAANRPVVVATANFKYSTGILDTSFNPGAGADSTVYGYTVQSDEKMIIYGSFSNYAGVARNKLARVNTDGTLDTSFSIGTGPSVNALPSDVLILSDGKILVVGSFTSFNGSARRQLVRLNADGSVDTTFDTGTGPNGTFVGTPLI